MNVQSLSDQVLLQQYLKGDEAALNVLISRYKNKVYTCIYVMVRDQYLAEDMFQDVFIKAVNKLRSGSYNEEGKFGAWLLRIAHNHCMDYFRKVKIAPNRKITTSNGEDIFKFIGEEDVPAETHYDVETKEGRLKLMLDQLPPDQREVIILRHFYNFSFKEVAAYTNVSVNTSLGRMRYALINLRKIIEEQKVEVF
jgi:RNA polymerase sigma factor (sigma-70 family)